MTPRTPVDDGPELAFNQLRVTDKARNHSGRNHATVGHARDRLVDSAENAVQSGMDDGGEDATERASRTMKTARRRGRGARRQAVRHAPRPRFVRQAAPPAQNGSEGGSSAMGNQLRSSRMPGLHEKGRAADEAHGITSQIMSRLRPAAMRRDAEAVASRVVSAVVEQAQRTGAAIAATLASTSATTLAMTAGVVLGVVALVAAVFPILDWLDQEDKVTYMQCAGGGGTLKIPAGAQQWVNEAAASSGLPASYVGSMMYVESGFQPAVFSNDINGGTWGLIQINAEEWGNIYPPGNTTVNGVPLGITDPDIHAKYGGLYLKQRMATVKALQASHKGDAFASLPILDALTIAHNAGEGNLMRYPAIPQITKNYLDKMHTLMGSSGVCTTGGASGPANLSVNGPCPLDVPGTTSCNQAIGFEVQQMKAIASNPNAPRWPGKCLGLVTTAYGGVWLGIFDASTAANMLMSEGKMHQTTDYASIPRGAVLWWTGGSHGYGHVAISVGNGQAISSDVPVLDGRIGTEPISYFTTNWHLNFAGYSAPVR